MADSGVIDCPVDALGYLPQSYAQEGRKLAIEYFGERFPVDVAAVGYRPLYDPENLKPKS